MTTAEGGVAREGVSARDGVEPVEPVELRQSPRGWALPRSGGMAWYRLGWLFGLLRLLPLRRPQVGLVLSLFLSFSQDP